MEKIIELVKSCKKIILNDALAQQVTEKGAADFVTKVDYSVQEFMKEELHRLYPDYLFMGEEGNHEELDREKPVWILDPVDGTTNLIHHYNTSAVSLGLCKN